MTFVRIWWYNAVGLTSLCSISESAMGGRTVDWFIIWSWKKESISLCVSCAVYYLTVSCQMGQEINTISKV